MTPSMTPIRRCAVALAIVLASACTAKADSPKAAGKAPEAKPATSPEARARAILQKQLKALPADNKAFIATFAKDAGLFVPNFPVKLDDEAMDIGGQIASMNPHAEMTSAKLGKLVAGGDPSVVWFAAEIEIVVVSREPENPVSTDKHAVRAVELLDVASDKIVAASFTEVRPLAQLRPTRGPIPMETPAGPLVHLLAAPDRLAGALAADSVVFGTDATERAVGSAAVKALLGKWRKLPLAIEDTAKVREVRTSAWGYAMAIVNIPKPGDVPYRMSAFLVALPVAGGTWQVVAASYGAL